MTSVNPATAEDRPTWVTIQMNTFTNWLNQQVSSVILTFRFFHKEFF